MGTNVKDAFPKKTYNLQTWWHSIQSLRDFRLATCICISLCTDARLSVIRSLTIPVNTIDIGHLSKFKTKTNFRLVFSLIMCWYFLLNLRLTLQDSNLEQCCNLHSPAGACWLHWNHELDRDMCRLSHFVLVYEKWKPQSRWRGWWTPPRLPMNQYIMRHPSLGVVGCIRFHNILDCNHL